MSSIPRGQTAERRAYLKAWHAANPRDRREYKRCYDASHQIENRAYREKNSERIKARKAAAHIRNRAANIAKAIAWANTNRERRRAYMREYYARNKAKVNAWHAPWYAANKDKLVVYAGRRRARKAGNGGSHTLEARIEKFKQMGNACFYCFETGALTVDHDVPIARGGTDDLDNILPACATCNKRKGTMTAQEFIATGRTNHTKIGGISSAYTGR